MKPHSCPNLTWGWHPAEPWPRRGETGVPVQQGGLQGGETTVSSLGGRWGGGGGGLRARARFSHESLWGCDPEGDGSTICGAAI